MSIINIIICVIVACIFIGFTYFVIKTYLGLTRLNTEDCRRISQEKDHNKEILTEIVSIGSSYCNGYEVEFMLDKKTYLVYIILVGQCSGLSPYMNGEHQVIYEEFKRLYNID